MGMDGAAKRLIALAVVAGFVLASVFLTFPAVDLWVSSLFFKANTFPAATMDLTAVLRQWVRGSETFIVASALVLLLLNLALRPDTQIPNRVTGFIVAAYVVGPGLIANALFKEHWGRARPYQVTEFGGAQTFTPPLMISDQCEGNCSFVSGEASSIFTVALSLVLILYSGLGRAGRIVLLSLAGASVFLGAGMRILKGRHFFSDVLYAFDFMTLCTAALFLLFAVHSCERPVTLSMAARNLLALPAALRIRNRKRPSAASAW